MSTNSRSNMLSFDGSTLTIPDLLVTAGDNEPAAASIAFNEDGTSVLNFRAVVFDVRHEPVDDVLHKLQDVVQLLIAEPACGVIVDLVLKGVSELCECAELIGRRASDPAFQSLLKREAHQAQGELKLLSRHGADFDGGRATAVFFNLHNAISAALGGTDGCGGGDRDTQPGHPDTDEGSES